MSFIDAYQTIFSNKKRILVVMAHPDDAEIYAGGTIARLVKDNKEVRVVKMTLGNKGSRDEIITEKDLSTLRYEEDNNAMTALGITKDNNIYLKFSDGEVENTLKEIESLAGEIRKFRPDLIITHNPEDMIIRFDKDVNWINHRDHRNTGKSAIDASYPYSRDVLFFPEQLTNPEYKSHSTAEYLLVDYYAHQDTIAIEVTDFVDIRTKAIASHISQYPMNKAQESTEFFTNIDNSNKRFERFRYVIAD